MVCNSRSFEVEIEICFRVMMGGHFMEFPALLVQPEPPAFAVTIVVLDAHVDHGGDPGKAVDHDCDQGSISKSNDVRRVDAVQQDSCVLGREDWRLALLDDVLGASDGCRRVEGDDLPDDQEIKQRANCGEMLLHGGRSAVEPQFLNIGCHQHRTEFFKRNMTLFAPVEEVAHCSIVRRPRIGIPDTCSKELKKSPRSSVASLRDNGGNQPSQRVGQLPRVVVRYFVCQSSSASILALRPIRSFR